MRKTFIFHYYFFAECPGIIVRYVRIRESSSKMELTYRNLNIPNLNFLRDKSS